MHYKFCSGGQADTSSSGSSACRIPLISTIRKQLRCTYLRMSILYQWWPPRVRIASRLVVLWQSSISIFFWRDLLMSIWCPRGAVLFWWSHGWVRAPSWSFSRWIDSSTWPNHRCLSWWGAFKSWAQQQRLYPYPPTCGLGSIWSSPSCQVAPKLYYD